VGNTFLDLIRVAHEQGDLLDPRTIKQALFYENYCNSSAQLKQCLGDHPLWPGLDANQDSPGRLATGGRPPFVDCALPCRWLRGTSRLGRFESAERTIARGATPADLRILADPRLPAAQRGALFDDLCKGEFAQRPLLWAYLRTADDLADPSRLMMDLGLIYALGEPPGTRYLLFDIEIAERRKPTWADADLAWYFDAALDAQDHGWTRSLTSGERGYQEWVAKGEHVGPVLDVLLIVPADVPAEPAPTFWDYHKNRIEQNRGTPSQPPN